MSGKKRKKWWKYLLVIPAVLIFDIIIFCAAALGDFALFQGSTATGHGFPVFTLLAGVLILIITALAVIWCIVMLIFCILRKPEPEAERVEEAGENHGALAKDKCDQW